MRSRLLQSIKCKIVLLLSVFFSGSGGVVDNCNPNPCKNGGVCHSECSGYYCECPTPFRWGRHCEEFSCDDSDECYNGGTCDRSLNGDDNREYRICTCPPGFMGRQCQVRIYSEPDSLSYFICTCIYAYYDHVCY